MERPASKLAIAAIVLAGLASPALAQNYDYLSRSDFVSLSGGDASRANIAIQTPTPWPSYVNDVSIPDSGTHAVSVLEMLAKRHAPDAAGPSTVINVGTGTSP